jgi:hypothetical protein
MTHNLECENIVLVDLNLLNYSGIYVSLKCSKQILSAWHEKFGFLADVLLRISRQGEWLRIVADQLFLIF